MTIEVTARQIQSFIYILDDAPQPLLDFYLENCDKVFESNKPWRLTLTKKESSWLRRELKSYIKTLGKMIKENQGTIDEYWINENKANRYNITLCKRVIEKL